MLKTVNPSLVNSSDEIISFLKENPHTGFMACSFDIKDLYYSLPHDELLVRIHDCIGRFGAVAYQIRLEYQLRVFYSSLKNT